MSSAAAGMRPRYEREKVKGHSLDLEPDSEGIPLRLLNLKSCSPDMDLQGMGKARRTYAAGDERKGSVVGKESGTAIGGGTVHEVGRPGKGKMTMDQDSAL